MAFCSKCGGPLGDGAAFCPSCGQPAGAAASGQPTAATPPPPAGSPYGAQSPYAQGYPQPEWGGRSKKKSRVGLWIALAALVAAIVVACILVFVVFHDDIFGGGASTPEAAVGNLLDAMEDGDIDAVFATMDQEALFEYVDEEDLDEFKEAMGAEMLEGGSMKFNDLEMTTTMDGEDAATVAITGGTVTMEYDGEEYTEDVSDADEPVEFDVIKRDGSWYVDPMALDW